MIVAVLLFLVMMAAHRFFYGGIKLQHYLVYCGLVLAASCLHWVLSSQGRRGQVYNLISDDDVSLSLGQTTFISLALFGFLIATKDQTISRIFLFTYLPLLFFLLVYVRKMSGKYLGSMFFARRHICNVLLVGEGRHMRALSHWVASKAAFGLKLLGWVSDSRDGDDGAPADLPKLGGVHEIAKVLETKRPDVVVVADLVQSGTQALVIRDLCEKIGARLVFGVDFGGAVVTCYEDNGLCLMGLRSEPLESPLNRMFKRTLDIAIALPVVTVVLPPVALIVWLGQKLQSPGPLFFLQDRVGYRGNRFAIYKFRTMHVNNPDEKKQAVKDDVRVYGLGRWLRRLSIDEFPQFWNVLKGDMSIVGPRPHLGAHDDEFALTASSYRVRSLVKPGITGLAQVRGYRGPTVTAEDVIGRVNSDIYYLENWSLKMDLIIILQTVTKFVHHQKGAV